MYNNIGSKTYLNEMNIISEAESATSDIRLPIT